MKQQWKLFFCLLCIIINVQSATFNPCPSGTSFDAPSGLCQTLLLAYGTFTEGMKNSCLLGLLGFCDTTKCMNVNIDLSRKRATKSLPFSEWNLLAMLTNGLLGNSNCMVGSTKNPDLDNLCYEDVMDGSVRNYFVFGPFDQTIVAQCLADINAPFCYSLRYPAEYYMYLRDVKNSAWPRYCDTNGDGKFDCPINWGIDTSVICCDTSDPDGDSVKTCYDLCPNDPNKIVPGYCGCGFPDYIVSGNLTCTLPTTTTTTTTTTLTPTPTPTPTPTSTTTTDEITTTELTTTTTTTPTPTPTQTSTTTEQTTTSTSIPTTTTDEITTTTELTTTPTPTPTTTSTDGTTTTTTDITLTPTPTPTQTPTSTQTISMSTPTTTTTQNSSVILPTSTETPTQTPTPTLSELQVALVASGATISLIAIGVVSLGVIIIMLKRKRDLKKGFDEEDDQEMRKVARTFIPSLPWLLDENGFSQLHYCAMNGDLQSLDRIVTLGKQSQSPDFSIDGFDTNSNTPLHWACSSSHVETVIYLLSQGGRVDLKNNTGETPFHYAAKNSNTSILEAILSKFVPPNPYIEVKDNLGNTPLMCSSIDGNIELVKLLLENGANPNNADYTGTTPLMASLKYANNNVVQVLINHGCGMSCVDRSGNQALHWGCFTGNTHGVQLLIEYRPPKEKQAFHQSLSFNEINNKGESALYLAVKEGHTDIVKLFFKKNKLASLFPKTTLQDLLVVARSRNHEKIVTFLESKLNTGFKYETNDSSDTRESPEPLEEISSKSPLFKNISDSSSSSPFIESANLTDFLSSDYSTPTMSPFSPSDDLFLNMDSPYTKESLLTLDENGFGLIHKVVAISDLRSLQTILSCANSFHELLSTVNLRDINQNTPIFYACQSVHPDANEILILLLDKGADPSVKNKFGETPLHFAARVNTNSLSVLLQRKVEVNVVDKQGQSPLFASCLASQLENAHRLIVAGAALNQRDNSSSTPLITVTRIPLTNVALFLIENNASLDLPDFQGNTVLHWASSCGGEEICREYLKRGRKVSAKNTQNNRKETALFLAVKQQHAQIVSLLLEHNADPFISDQRGRNCFTLEKTEEIGRLLEKYSKKNQYPDSHDQDVLLSI